MMIRAVRDTLALLNAGHVVIIFPEAYPNIDPGLTPKTSPDAFLSFRAGFARLAQMAARRGLQVPIVPAGFTYHQRPDRWHVELRFGEPVFVEPGGQTVEHVVRVVEDHVRALSTSGVPC